MTNNILAEHEAIAITASDTRSEDDAPSSKSFAEAGLIKDAI